MPPSPSHFMGCRQRPTVSHVPCSKEIKPLIHWGVVALAGGAAWLLVVGVIAVSGARDKTSPAEVGEPPIEQPVVAVAEVAGPLALAQVGVPASLPSPTQEQPPSYQKAPASPPIPSAPEGPAALLSALALPERIAAPQAEAARKCGTKVAFLDSPAEAAHKALEEQKLLFVIHLSGNFEDAQFT